MSDDIDDERLAGLPPLDEPEPEKKQRKRKKQEEQDRAEMLEQAYRDLLALPAGRMVLYDRLDKAGYWNVPFDPTSAHITAYLAGNHAAAVELYETLWALSPDDVLTMMKENRK